MCLFPIINQCWNGSDPKSILAYNCNYCPECLKQRANVWALRSVYQSRESVNNMMVTLTYDSYKYVNGIICGENAPDPDIKLSKRHIQLFFKRLRKFIGDKCKIKYIVCGEHGSRTNRAHYHALIFGFKFDDLVPYKKSKRGNQIYKSASLTSLWSHGICTVDSIHINSAVSRYCTKYIAKNTRTEDCFMLFSHGIGEEGLLRDFNGKNYVVEGKFYPIPKQIWNKVIMQRYPFDFVDYRYVGRDRPGYDYARSCRVNFRAYRDNDSQYQAYLAYWNRVSESYAKSRPDVFTRISQLPLHFYKGKAFEALKSRLDGIFRCPRKPLGEIYSRSFERSMAVRFGLKVHLPRFSRLYTANDTIYSENPFDNWYDCMIDKKNRKFMEKFSSVRLT